ncbi:MAG TPA: UvrD-helicase domain-containing protein [Acidobacteriaceae bacterium]|nr:UvrD-helicase domain-containing protein [Acidobacteriaceae bacterium]
MNNLLLFPSPDEPPGPPDAATRAEALNIRRSFIVQAPAGSGKTGLLIQRLLKLLGDDSVTQPEQVLAITFTNAATAEMRDRVLKELEKVQEPASQNEAASLTEDSKDFESQTLHLAHQVLARDHALGWQLLKHPHRLNIRTIDSVCTEIARSLPVLSGSGGRLRPTEDAGPLHHEAARRTLLLLGHADKTLDGALRDLLLHRDGNLDDCTSLLAEMLALRDQWGELVPLERRELDEAWLDRELLPRLERTLQDAISSALRRLEAVFPPDLLRQVSSLAGHLGHLQSTNDSASPISCCAGVHDPPEPVATYLARWRALIHILVTAGGNWRQRLSRNDLKFDLDKNNPHRRQLEGILDQLRHRDDLLAAIGRVNELPDARYPPDQWAVAKSLFRVLSRALVELQLVFAEHNRCDFTELNLLARSALRSGPGPSDLASALGGGLQHLLVDEMQDTSTGQYELLELLTASWDGHSQTVFLVGDPCQSIYLFRQARVERFLSALETCQLGEISLTPLALTANFRSQQTLVDQFNDDFALIFPNVAEDGGALHYIDAAATQPPSSAADGRVWHANPQPAASSTSVPVSGVNAALPTQARRDADAIAAIAEAWLKRPLPANRDEPWRIAVLVRSRNHLAEVVPALRRAGVPFRAIDIETLRDRQEVLDLVALTRALLHPADRVAALAVLRAPWCGLSLADLHTLTGMDDPSLSKISILRLIGDRTHLLPPESQRRLARVRDVLRAAAAIRSRVSAAQLVERAWRSLGGDASLTPAEFTNGRRFFELLDTLEAAGGPWDASHMEERLTQLYAEPDPLAANSGFVELLTIHKAKGLEWDVVFVPALERQAGSSPARVLTWAVLDELEDSDAAPIMLAPISARGEEVDALTVWLKGRHRDREYAENKRLFYVACTRARQELHLFAAPNITATGVSSGAADSLLKAAWDAAEPHFTNLPAAAASVLASPPLDDGIDIDIAAVGLDAHDKLDDDSSPSSSDIQAERQVMDANLVPSLYPVIRRLPLAFEPASALVEARAHHLPYGRSSPVPEGARFTRPEGSLAARSFGNTVHACIDRITARIATGPSVASILTELPSWSPRIAALLRADGLSETTVRRLAREARTALQNLLSDPDGQWLISSHSGSASEFSLTAAPDLEPASGRSISVRADRIFFAGPEPHAPGATHLWIVDYKTASHGASQIAGFLNAQRAAYSRQLETYARILAPARSVPLENICLALYFPALPQQPRLIWWQPESLSSSECDAIPLQMTD